MAKWLRFGSHTMKKSTKELYAEMQRLEKAEKDAAERALIEKRVYEIKHAKRISFLNAARRFGSSAATATQRVAQSKQAKKLYKKVMD